MADGAHALVQQFDVASTPPAVIERAAVAPARGFKIPLLPSLSRREPRPLKRVLAFMLPGGGAHGCFGAAVMATLLTHPDFANVDIVASVGASAGAINGAIATAALQQGGMTESQRRRDAAHRLDVFWQKNVIQNFWLSGMMNAVQATTAYCGQMMGNQPAWVPECTLNGHYVNRFLEPLVAEFIGEKPLSRAKKHLPQLHVGTSRCVDRDLYEPALHSNDKIDTAVLMASGGLVNIFGARKLSDGHWHADGAYTANPNDMALQGMDGLTDVIWVMNDPADRPISKGSKLKSAWNQIAPYRQAEAGPRHHEIHLDRRLPEITRIMPTTSQNETLWKDGTKAALDFVERSWTQPARYAAA